jgi:hypothetical protein
MIHERITAVQIIFNLLEDFVHVLSINVTSVEFRLPRMCCGEVLHVILTFHSLMLVVF